MTKLDGSRIIVNNSPIPLRNPPGLLPALALLGALLLSACGTTRVLPQYEAPMARSDFQTVRTTAYTHTESDHREFTNHNALGGELHAAGPAIKRAENVARAIPVTDDDVDVQRVSNSGAPLQPFSLDPRTTRRVSTTTITRRSRYALPRSTACGSAAADWSRWPAGTVFRLLSTGQIYRVDDYGWALAGRNTIDLYMANQRDMNNWGARQESIEILRWGDPQESLRLLGPHKDYKHIRRMVLELQGRDREAAALH
jgi:3D (Asp-Asp-Asp) domain-containing protein